MYQQSNCALDMTKCFRKKFAFQTACVERSYIITLLFIAMYKQTVTTFKKNTCAYHEKNGNMIYKSENEPFGISSVRKKLAVNWNVI